MGLATRIIPVLLKRGRNLVKGQQFQSWRVVGHALQSVRTHDARGVDELIFLDIGATPEGRGPDFELVRELTEDCFMPVTVGGGVRSISDVRRLLEAGADKVAIGTAAFNPDFIREAADKFGRQAIVVSMDVRDGCIFTHCGKVKSSSFPRTFSMNCVDAGAGEILLTSIEREGTMFGYDIDLIKSITEFVNVPVVAHGGCGTPKNMLEAIEAGASAVAAGAMFQFTDITPKDCAKYLHECGVEVRL